MKALRWIARLLGWETPEPVQMPAPVLTPTSQLIPPFREIVCPCCGAAQRSYVRYDSERSDHYDMEWTCGTVTHVCDGKEWLFARGFECLKRTAEKGGVVCKFCGGKDCMICSKKTQGDISTVLAELECKMLEPDVMSTPVNSHLRAAWHARDAINLYFNNHRGEV